MYEDTPPSNRFGTLVIAIAIVLVLALGLAGVLAVAAIGGRPGVDTRPVAVRPNSPPARPESRPKPAAGDPWPECTLVRQWLNENSSEPATVEIIRWESRQVIPVDDTNPREFVSVTARYRGKNQYGGYSVETTGFHLRDGKVVATVR